jgi:hypothetical protein
MAAIADTVTISIFIGLIVCAICFYLFTRIKQTEKKLALMEGILLDLKTATESNFLESPAATEVAEVEAEDSADQYIPMLPEDGAAAVAMADMMVSEDATHTIELSQEMLGTIHETDEPIQVNKVAETDLESLSISELQSLARSKNVANTRKMRKSELISAIKGLETEATGVVGASDDGSLLAAPL